MNNTQIWQSSKYEIAGGHLRASRNDAEVSLGSRFITDLVAEVYAKTLVQHARGKLLDVGCGKVPLYGTYRDLVDEAVCVDWGNSPHQTSHLDVEADLNKGLPQPSGVFDTVLATDVLEHICKPDFLFSEMVRTLKPGGKLILGVPFMYWIHEAPHDYHRYTEFKLRAMCEENEMLVEELHAIGGWYVVLIDLLMKRFARKPVSGALVRALGALYLWKRGNSADWSQDGIQLFPLSYCLVAAKGEAEKR